MNVVKTIFSNWHLMRWIRLGAGLFLAFQAIELANPGLGLLSALFLFQALFNAGCCAGSCPPPRPRSREKAAEVEFEEVKTFKADNELNS